MTSASKRTRQLLVAIAAVALIASVAVFAAPPAVVTDAGPSVGSGQSPTGPTQARVESSTAANVEPGPVIVSDPVDSTISRYGTRTKTSLRVSAEGSKLHYRWLHRSASGGSWKTISGAKSRRYVARASKWPNGTRFRVIVSNTAGKVTSATAVLTVLHPTKSPAGDAEAAFGLSGLTQGVDLSAYQHTPSAKVKVKAVAAWAGTGGFAILRNGSGARPIRQKYTNVCTNKTRSTGSEPVVEDCAYRTLADSAGASGLTLGHYWFNGWISSIDSTKRQLFAGGFTPQDSAYRFVDWLTTDGNYTKDSTAPLVLDVEAGHAWTRTYKGKKYSRTLRAWNPGEAAQFLSTVRTLLTNYGYHANLYVYMSANAAARESGGAYVWSGVTGLARLWVASWGTNNGRIPDAQPKVGPWADAGGWSIWQYTSNAAIPGDGVGAIDGDIATADAWMQR